MSVCMFLLPLSIALLTTTIEGAGAIVDAVEKSKTGNSSTIETRFNNAELLRKTLMEYGARVSAKSDNSIVADFENATILYERADTSKPYGMRIVNMTEQDSVICTVQEIEVEYNSNVQSYTYNKVKNDISKGMSIESEEVLEDNSILITLNVN